MISDINRMVFTMYDKDRKPYSFFFWHEDPGLIDYTPILFRDQYHVLEFMDDFNEIDNLGWFWRELLLKMDDTIVSIHLMNDNEVKLRLADLIFSGSINVHRQNVKEEYIQISYIPREEIPLPVQKIADNRAIRKPEVPKDWIEIELLDYEEKPVAKEAYKIVLADGKTIQGKLNDEGKAMHENIRKGECKVTFPEVGSGGVTPYEEPQQNEQEEATEEFDDTDQQQAEQSADSPNRDGETEEQYLTEEEQAEQSAQFDDFNNYVKSTYDKLESLMNTVQENSTAGDIS